jgi:hypothetical protein
MKIFVRHQKPNGDPSSQKTLLRMTMVEGKNPMRTLYLHKRLIFIISLLLFLITDTYTNFYPLYLSLQENAHLIERLATQYHAYRSAPSKPNTSASTLIQQQPQISMTTYPVHQRMSRLTEKMAHLAINIKKIESIERQSAPSINPLATNAWAITASGNAHSLYAFFQLLYHDFPWLMINEPFFVMHGNTLNVSFQLIALQQTPNRTLSLLPRMQLNNGAFPFCQSTQHTNMQANLVQHKKAVGFIYYNNRKAAIFSRETN